MRSPERKRRSPGRPSGPFPRAAPRPPTARASPAPRAGPAAASPGHRPRRLRPRPRWGLVRGRRGLSESLLTGQHVGPPAAVQVDSPSRCGGAGSVDVRRRRRLGWRSCRRGYEGPNRVVTVRGTVLIVAAGGSDRNSEAQRLAGRGIARGALME